MEDSDGNWYVSDDWTKSVVQFDSSGTMLGLFATAGGLVKLTGVAFDEDENLYVSNRVSSLGDHTPGSSVLKFGSTGQFLNVELSGGLLNDPEDIVFV